MSDRRGWVQSAVAAASSPEPAIRILSRNLRLWLALFMSAIQRPMAQLGARAENVYSQPDKLEDDPHRGVGKFRIAIEEILSQLRFHTDEGVDFIFRQALKQLLVLLGELVTGTDQTRVHKALYRTRTLHNPLLEVSSPLQLLSDLHRPNKNSSRIAR